MCLAALWSGAVHAEESGPKPTFDPSLLICRPPIPASVWQSLPVPVVEEPPRPERPRTVLLLGDSLIATGFGQYLEDSLNAHPLIRSARRAKSSTGLARPDFFDWMAVGREEVERHQPDVVVVILGGNDGQSLTDDTGRAEVRWGQSGWEEVYRRRTEAFLELLSAPGRRILWLELPPTKLKNFERKLTLIRRLQREVLATREDARYLDTHPFFTDGKGSLLLEARVQGFRKPMKLKLADGVHFSVAGGRYFANKVFPHVMELLELPLEPDA
ncbi:MAG TPA: DUF459 domain-containing protein [Myxococcaceae bacterium]|nr:DUF459 domain-containing protein [Myxococcaceae bacterium]